MQVMAAKDRSQAKEAKIPPIRRPALKPYKNTLARCFIDLSPISRVDPEKHPNLRDGRHSGRAWSMVQQGTLSKEVALKELRIWRIIPMTTEKDAW